MEYIREIFHFILNIDQYIGWMIQSYGMWVYLVLFIIVFCETGLIVTPFLPGDSLLFASGAFAASGDMNIIKVYGVFLLAAVLGDTVNFHIGRFIGPKIYHKKRLKLIKKEHLDKTHQFYERHGGKTIILARFIPIIRTFAPFVAGIGDMSYIHFITYNIVGAILWVTICVFTGYYFGNLPYVQEHFEIVVLGIIFVSLLPVLIEIVKNTVWIRIKNKKN